MTGPGEESGGTAKGQPTPGHPVIGLIGGIGSGKSQVAALLAEQGAKVVSGDELAHEVLRQPEVREQIVARWGREILGPDGEVDRKRLAGVVFADPVELKALEALVHPEVRRRIAEEVRRARQDANVSLVVVDAAILLEAGWSELCDRLVFVDTPAEVRRERVSRQRRWTVEDLERRESMQLALTEKRLRADHVVENSSDLEHLRRQVDTLLHLWDVSDRGPPLAATAATGKAHPQHQDDRIVDSQDR